MEITHDEVIDRLMDKIADLTKENVVLNIAIEKLSKQLEDANNDNAKASYDDSEPF